MTLRLFVCRHGNTFEPGDTPRRVGARTDLALTASGEAQARILADYLNAAGATFVEAACSELQRTRRTAKTILSRNAGSPDLEIDPFLTEIDYGPDENRTEDEVIARIGAEALDAWNDTGAPPPGWRVDPETLVAGWRDRLEDIAKRRSDGDVLIVTSNGIARFLARAISGAQDTPPQKMATGAFSELVKEPDRWRIAQWNVRPVA